MKEVQLYDHASMEYSSQWINLEGQRFLQCDVRMDSLNKDKKVDHSLMSRDEDQSLKLVTHEPDSTSSVSTKSVIGRHQVQWFKKLYKSQNQD